MSEREDKLTTRAVSRRDFLKIAGIAGATVGMGAGLGGLLAGCGDDEPETTTTTAPAANGETTTTAPGETTTTVDTDAEMGRELRIGFVAPLTGPLASFGVPDRYCADRAREGIGEGLISQDGMRHPVNIIVRDSQSDSNRAAQVTGDLIANDRVDIMVTASTPDTVAPVSDQAEALETPCISNDCPWQPYVGIRTGGDLSATFRWTYHTFWGLEDAQANFLDMWRQVDHNNVVAAMWPNDADGNAWQPGWQPVWEPAGLTVVDPGLFTPFSEDYTAQLSAFTREGAEIGMGVFIPPDFTNFWRQAAQQGWRPKVGTYAKALLFPESVEALGQIGDGLTTEVWWMPTHPFTSSLLGESCQEFADEYTRRTGSQWTQPLLHFIIFDLAADVIERTANLDDKESIMEAIRTINLDTIGGRIDFTEPVAPPGPPWEPGPRRIHENVYKTPQVGGQWRVGTDYPFELTVVSNAAAPDIPVQDSVQPLAGS